MPRAPHPTLRDDILAAALRLIDEKGLAALSMRELGKAVGFSATTIYHYFANRDALLLELKIEIVERMFVEMQRAAAAPTTEQQFIGMARRYIEFGLDHPAEYRLLTQTLPPNLPMTAEQFERFRIGWDTMTEVLRQWLKEYNMQTTDVRREMQAAWAMVHGITSLAIADRLPFAKREEAFAVFELMVDRWVGRLRSFRQTGSQTNNTQNHTRQRRTAQKRTVRQRSETLQAR